MDCLHIDGGHKLSGETTVSGMKNSALPIIFACILVDGECIIDNIPRVSDVENALLLLRTVGARRAEFVDKNTVLIDTDGISSGYVPNDTPVGKMRASSYLMGTLLSRVGSVSMMYPGGCNFGVRPIDIHLKGFQKMGAKCYEMSGRVNITAYEKLKNAEITLDKISVGATINMIMSSVKTDGVTVIERVAKEPHVDDLINFLNECGANIKREEDRIIVHGVKKLHSVRYRIYSDTVESLTYIACVGAVGGKITLHGVDISKIEYPVSVFKDMGIEFSIENGDMKVVSEGTLNGANIVTAPYPAFPTDLHPQFAAMLCFSGNGGSIREEIFPNRFGYVSEFEKMGAKIKKSGNTVFVFPSEIHGANTSATDLRAGAGLIVSALGARGESTIDSVEYILRGYENIVSKISSLGGNIEIIQKEI